MPGSPTAPPPAAAAAAPSRSTTPPISAKNAAPARPPTPTPTPPTPAAPPPPPGAGASLPPPSLPPLAANDWATLVEGGYTSNTGPIAGSGLPRRAFEGTFGTYGLFDTNGVIHPAGSPSLTTTR